MEDIQGTVLVGGLSRLPRVRPLLSRSSSNDRHSNKALVDSVSRQAPGKEGWETAEGTLVPETRKQGRNLPYTPRPSGSTRYQLLATCLFLILPLGAVAQGDSKPPKPVYFDYPLTNGEQQKLQWNTLPHSLTLQMELRSRTEGQTSFSLLSGNERVYDLTRIRGGLEFRPTSFLSAFIEFQDTHALGLPVPSVQSNMRDQFDLFAANVTLHSKQVKVVSGRQPLKFGSQRLVGVSNWTNNSRSWDGFYGQFGNRSRLELFSTSVVEVHPTSLDKHGAGLTFHGAVGTIGILDPNLEIQPFVYIRALPRVVSQQGIAGSEVEETFGTELSGTEKRGIDFDVLGALQRGSYANDSIHSGAVYVKLGYLLSETRLKPRFVGEYNYATGNPHSNPNRISTFDQQYPSNHNAFGLVDLFGFRNMTSSQADVNLTPAKDFFVRLQAEAVHVANAHDDVYSSGGAAFVKSPAGGFRSTRLGEGVDVSSIYVFRRYLLVEAGVGHFFPGPVMTENQHASPLTIGYLQFTYRFNVASGSRQAGP